MTKNGEKKIELNDNSMIVDINMIEAPIFYFNQRRKNTTVENLLGEENIDKNLKRILSLVPKESANSIVQFREWRDSKENKRALLSMSTLKFPDAFAMDVLFGVIALFIEKSTPIIEEDNKLPFKTNEVKFKISELCRVMKIEVKGGKEYKRIEDALLKLDAVKYYSLQSGVFYSKELNKYISSEKDSINLIDKVTFRESTSDGYCRVVLGELIINNLIHKHIKFLEKRNYFSLESGLTRRLYSYIESNSYEKNYIKRSYEVIKNKIPLDFKYPAELKRRLKLHLENLIRAGVITDYMYGDEIKIGGIKEQCIYFIFKGTKASVIKAIEDKIKQDSSSVENIKNELAEETELVFPENIEFELESFGINKKKISEIIKTNTKWKIAEYILWLKDGIRNGKVKDPAGLFVFAITDEMVKVKSTHPNITEFINNLKNKSEGKLIDTLGKINKEYKKYIDAELKLFEKEDEFAFIATRQSVYDDIKSCYKKRIKSQRQLYNLANTQDEKDKILSTINKWEEFPIKEYDSELFLEMFIKKIKVYRNLKDFEDFRNAYLSNNK